MSFQAKSRTGKEDGDFEYEMDKVNSKEVDEVSVLEIDDLDFSDEIDFKAGKPDFSKPLNPTS